MGCLRISKLSYDNLREKAAAFLRSHHPSGAIPVPIEELVDLKFEIDIVPTPGLHKAYDTDAWVTSDRSTIYVDEFVYESRPNRYRFSLAHELAHLVLHSEVLGDLSFSTIAEWRGVVSRIDEEDYGWLEWQAYAFAGLILVPSDPLRSRFRQAASAARDALAERGLSPEELSSDAVAEPVLRRIASRLAEEFEVSPTVVEKRLQKDDLWDVQAI